MNFPRCLSLLLPLFFLASCTLVPVAQRSTRQGPLEYAICDKGLDVQAKYRAFQGLNGWFYYAYDLEPSYPLMAQTESMTELARRLKVQGVQLVIVPMPGRAVVSPQNLYPDDPRQAAFKPAEGTAQYEAFVEKLREGGVFVFDVLAAAQASNAQGQQTFFKRDLHWTTEGAKLFSRSLAKELSRLNPDLPETEVDLQRGATNYEHRGKFVSRWSYTYCGYVLPTEPQPTYTVTKKSSGGLFGNSAPEVVLAGSSFSLPPYNYDFLAAGLQSDVLNVSVGAGGAAVALQSYLVDGAFEARKPKFLVWEFPTFAPELSNAEQRQILASVNGRCDAPASTVQLGEDFKQLLSVPLSLEGKPVDTRSSYLQVEFSDLSLLTFDLTLSYKGGKEETLHISRSNLVPNRGLYFFSLNEALGDTLKRVRFELPAGTPGDVFIKICRKPRNLLQTAR